MHDMMPFIAAFVTAAAGACLAFLPGFLKRRKARRCSLSVDARVAGMLPADYAKAGGKIYHTYWITWEYAVSGKSYRTRCGLPVLDHGRKIGSVDRIRVNPDDPSEIYIPEAADRKAVLAMRFFGIVVLLASIQGLLEAFGLIR